MNAKKMIAELMHADMTQAAIAEAIGISQSGVSRIATGVQKKLEFEAGDKLRDLHARNAKKGRK